MELQLLFLLLPFAALTGWWIGRREHTQNNARVFGYRDDYFRGLNYLINEQPDKAIEVLVRMVGLDSETIETHFALGSLFRRRGEVDRAIRIHQNLIARPGLSAQQRNQALFELARDYQSAGLLDRAENLYEELAEDRQYGPNALRQLLDIYQQEREWKQAIEVAERLLRSKGGVEIEDLLGHFHCELAELALGQEQLEEALGHVKRAGSIGRGSARASLLEGQIALALGQGESAIRALQQVEGQALEFLPEILEPLEKAYRLANKDDEWQGYLDYLISKHPFTSVILARCAEEERKMGPSAAARLLGEFLERHPSVVGMERLLQLQEEVRQTEGVATLAHIAQRLTQAKPRYRCSHCGFSSRTLYWQCPGCKRWSSIKPIHGIEGE